MNYFNAVYPFTDANFAPYLAQIQQGGFDVNTTNQSISNTVHSGDQYSRFVITTDEDCLLTIKGMVNASYDSAGGVSVSPYDQYNPNDYGWQWTGDSALSAIDRTFALDANTTYYVYFRYWKYASGTAYTETFDVTQITLRAKPSDSDETGGVRVDCYMRGAFGGNTWPALDEYQFRHRDGEDYYYLKNVTIQGEYKIASGNWSDIDYGVYYYSSSEIPTDTLYTMYRGGSNCSFANATTISEVRFYPSTGQVYFDTTTPVPPPVIEITGFLLDDFKGMQVGDIKINKLAIGDTVIADYTEE